MEFQRRYRRLTLFGWLCSNDGLPVPTHARPGEAVSNTLSIRSLLVTDRDAAADPWRIPLLLLWQLVFLIGLAPELVFLALRKLGAVSAFGAMVNSAALISITLSFYVALFVWRRCREQHLSVADAAGKAFQFGLFAMMAFMVSGFRWDEPGILLLLWHIREIPVDFLQFIVFLMGFAKLTAWLYLFVMFFRFYALGDEAVFARSASIFPSSYIRPEQDVLNPPSEPELGNKS
jgi:hypothetical protein